ncbi:MAG: hypothetical protein ACFFCK_09415, partial [Promethearchaeota archaeon]
MNRRLTFAVILVATLFVVMPVGATPATPSQSPVVNLDSIYVDVVVLPNGRINVTYWITISVLDGSLGGFDLLGIQESTIYDPDRAYAEVGGNKYNLVVGTRSTGYALDWTPRTQSGENVTVVFGYFSTNRVVEKTLDLAVFHWSPVQWEVSVDYQNVRVIYPIEMNATWISGDGGITQEGADYAGYITDYREGVEDNFGTLYPFDENNTLAYPSSPTADPRYFSVSLEHNNLDPYDHFIVWHYVNWSWFAPYLLPGALGYETEQNINVDANTEFEVELDVFNYGDAPLDDVTVSMSVPDNLTLTSGQVVTYLGSLDGGDISGLAYRFIPDNIPTIVQITFQISASNLNTSDWVTLNVDVYIREVIPPLIPPAVLVFGFTGIAAVGIIYAGYRRVTGHYGAHWEADDTTSVYQSPEISIQTFGTPGTVADLDPVESAFFVNTTRKKLVSMILMSCVRKGAVRVLSSDPLKLSDTGIRFEDLTYYEEMFVDSIDNG